MQGVLERGGHLGMLIDQHFTRGVMVDFMGRPALANPILGKFARRFDCPVHGVRVIRLPDHRFRLQLTPPLDLPRDRRRADQRAGRHAGDDRAWSRPGCASIRSNGCGCTGAGARPCCRSPRRRDRSSRTTCDAAQGNVSSLAAASVFAWLTSWSSRRDTTLAAPSAWLALLRPASAAAPSRRGPSSSSSPARAAPSCPPADALLAELARVPDVIALSFPVDLLGLSRLEGHARPAGLQRAPAGLCPCPRRPAGLHAADDRQRQEVLRRLGPGPDRAGRSSPRRARTGFSGRGDSRRGERQGIGRA